MQVRHRADGAADGAADAAVAVAVVGPSLVPSLVLRLVRVAAHVRRATARGGGAAALCAGVGLIHQQVE